MVICDNCGRTVPPEYSAVEMPKEVTLCGDCWNAYLTCHSCKQAKICPFQEYQGPDKLIQKQVQTPQGIFSAHIPNPDVIERFCKTCKCYGADIGCMKEFGSCQNYSTIFNLEKIYGRTEH